MAQNFLGHSIEDVYRGVMNDVINHVKEAFLDENVDIDVLQQLKQLWENKLRTSGAVDLDGPKLLVRSTGSQHRIASQTQNAPSGSVNQQNQQNMLIKANVNRTDVFMQPNPVVSGVITPTPATLDNTAQMLLLQQQQQQIQNTIQENAQQQQFNCLTQVLGANPNNIAQQQISQTQIQLWENKLRASRVMDLDVQRPSANPSSSQQRVVNQNQNFAGNSQIHSNMPMLNVNRAFMSTNSLIDRVIAPTSAVPNNNAQIHLLHQQRQQQQIQNSINTIQQQAQQQQHQFTSLSQILDASSNDFVQQQLAQTQPSKSTSKTPHFSQLDGGAPGMSDSSTSEEEDDEDEINKLKCLQSLENDKVDDSEGGDNDPLNSDDDQSDDEDLETLFEAENVVVCQFEKVHRARNKWKFTLKDGIMRIDGKEYCFQKCSGEAEW